LEAAAMGVPIISSWAPGCNEIFVNNKSGLYFNRSDLFELARKVDLLIKNDHFREDIVKNARESVIKFNLDNYMLKLVSLYSNPS
jgi:glycosyltransferase involved in cell wall biosynthesis